MSRLRTFWKALFGQAEPDDNRPPVKNPVQEVVPPAGAARPLADRGGQRPIIPASIHGIDMSRGKL